MPIPSIQFLNKISKTELSGLAKYGIAYIPIPNEVTKTLEQIKATGKKYFNGSKDQKQQYPYTKETCEGFFDQQLNGYDMERYIIRKSMPKDPVWNECGAEMLKLKDYFKYDIIQPLLLALFEHLKIDSEKIKAYFDKSDSTLSIVYYPKCDEGAHERIQSHQDAALMTVLWSQKPGLEVEIDNKWHTDLVKKGHIIVHLGSAIALMTDNRCHAVTHRVQVSRDTSRISIASFYTQNPKSYFFNVVTGEKITETFEEYALRCLKKTYPQKPNKTSLTSLLNSSSSR